MRCATRSSDSFPRRSQAYSACRTRARARVSTLVRGIEAIEQVDHLQRGERRIPPLVAVRAARARLRLLVVVTGEDAESDRRIELGAGASEAARRLARDVVEMGRVAANHRADGHE